MTTTRKHKKNLIVSYKNLTDEQKELFKEAYPDGYKDYVQRFQKPNGDTIFVVPFETEDTAYMVKFEMVIDTLTEDLDKALFDEDDESKETEFAPLSEALEKEESDSSHREKVLRHGDFEATLEEDENRKKKLSLGINKEEFRAAFGDEEAEELDSYEKIGEDDDEPVEDEYEPSDEDLRDIEDEYLDMDLPPLDDAIPEDALLEDAPKASRKKKK